MGIIPFFFSSINPVALLSVPIYVPTLERDWTTRVLVPVFDLVESCCVLSLEAFAKPPPCALYMVSLYTLRTVRGHQTPGGSPARQRLAFSSVTGSMDLPARAPR